MGNACAPQTPGLVTNEIDLRENVTVKQLEFPSGVTSFQINTKANKVDLIWSQIRVNCDGSGAGGGGAGEPRMEGGGGLAPLRLDPLGSFTKNSQQIHLEPRISLIQL